MITVLPGQLALFAFELPAAAPAWRMLEASAIRKGGTWQHASGWLVIHCGHPTANYPYALEHPDRSETVVSCDGRGFRSAAIARAVVERIAAGLEAISTDNCRPGVAVVKNVTCVGTPVPGIAIAEDSGHSGA